MILKIGYYGKDGIECYRYFEDFEDIIVADINAGYEYSMREDRLLLDGKQLDSPEFCMFNSSKIESDVSKVIYVIYYTGEGHMTTIAALGGTVYLMNENGKTVDRY